jgi:hypothetical protein
MFPNISQLVPGTFIFDKSPYLMESCGWSLIYLGNRVFEFSYSIRHSSRRKLEITSNMSSRVLFDLKDSGWSHITLLKELQTLSTYRDDLLINSTSIPFSVSLPYSSIPLIIGTSKDVLLQSGNNSFNSSYYSGGLDDIFIYNRALSVGEILQVREFSAPTSVPSAQPSMIPSVQPSSTPSERPTTLPTSFPSDFPTGQPACFPSGQPTSFPSRASTNQPTAFLPVVRPINQLIDLQGSQLLSPVLNRLGFPQPNHPINPVVFLLPVPRHNQVEGLQVVRPVVLR